MRNKTKSDSSQKDESNFNVPLFPNLRVESAVGIEFENQAIDQGYKFIAGVDEVGRGCLAGCVVAAACILRSPLTAKS